MPWPEPLQIYIHWPFCTAKCPYCDFNSHVRRRIDPDRWQAALLRGLDRAAERTGPRRVETIFFGGGTPSLMPPALVGAVIDRVAARWALAADAEITLEANPTSVEAARFRGFRTAGVNRVSVGVQALDDHALRQLGRLHDADEALAAVALARAVFDRVSADLIYARQGQDLAAWADELDRVLKRGLDHLSLYQLTIEPGTAFAARAAVGGLPGLPDADLGAQLYEHTQHACSAAGLPAYEISNHAAPGAECRHNLAVWRGGDYLGLGPGAHGRVTLDGIRIATAALRSPEAWLAAVEAGGDGLAEAVAVPPAEAGLELLLTGLRLAEGCDLARIEALMGRRLDAATLAMLEAEGLIRRPQGRLVATPAGRLVLDSVLASLVADAERPGSATE